MKVVMLFIIGLVSLVDCRAKEPNWLIRLRNITVLESKRADVEKTFGTAKIMNSYAILEKGRSVGSSFRYLVADGMLDVEYSGGTCSELKSPFGYDVASGTVTELRFEPNRPVKSSSLEFDLDTFLKQPVKDVPGLSSLISSKQGVKLTMYKAKVTEIVFFPSIDADHLECNEEKAK